MDSGRYPVTVLNPLVSRRRSQQASWRTIRHTLEPPKKLKVSEWAAKHRILPETAAEPGLWQNDRTPYLVGIMDACLEPGVELVGFMKPAQVGGSEALNNVLAYFIGEDPSSILFVQIGEKEAKAYSKERIAPMIADCPILKNRVAAVRTRDEDNTTLTKSFAGGHLAIAGANAPAGLRSRPRRILIGDEIDGWPPSAGTEGDPLALAEARLRTFWNSIEILCSTPTLEGLSRIEKVVKECDEVRAYHVPCIHCGHQQQLLFPNLTWDKDEDGKHLPETAQYACDSCGAMIPERHKKTMLAHGEWLPVERDEKDEKWIRAEPHGRPRSIGFILNALYSPWMKWREIVQGFLKAKGDPLRLQVWVNTVLGEVFKEKGVRLDAHPLLARCEVYPAEPVPEQVLFITAGVDVQADRFEVELVGWGLNYESWSLDFIRIPGDPSVDGGIWDRLDHVLSRHYDHPSGLKLIVAATAMDSGYETQQVYKYCKDRLGANVWAIKGFDGPGRPVWDKPTKRNKYKVPMFPVGVDTAKTTIYAHLRNDKPDDWAGEPVPGYCHFPAREPYDEEYFKQLTSEKVVIRMAKNGVMKRQWIRRPGRRAEALDCRVYAYAAFEASILAGVRLEQIAASIKAGGAQRPKRNIRHKGVTPG
jgi:phage terminase large subunit GpA-like protein